VVASEATDRRVVMISLFATDVPKVATSGEPSRLRAYRPVALPAGCARLATNPAPTGSATCTNTMGHGACRSQ
jgi:hypothetical protein